MQCDLIRLPKDADKLSGINERPDPGHFPGLDQPREVQPCPQGDGDPRPRFFTTFKRK